MENMKKDLENMKQVYGVKGTLPKDFVGQISYTVCLDKPYEELDIEFSFDKQHYSPVDLTPVLLKELRTLCRREYDMELSDAELERLAYQEMKTEIHTLASLNDSFIGCIHRQLPVRHMHFTPSEATEGCLPQSVIEGVLKVTVLVFNVLLDETNYSLTVRVR